MSFSIDATIYCDQDDSTESGCDAKVTARSVYRARLDAEKQGWLVAAGHGTADFCPKHTPEED